MTAPRPNELGLLAAARSIEDGTLTSEALVRACLERIEARNAEVRAFVALDPPRAIEAARAADKAHGGLLRGLPFAVKDVFDTADYPTAYGSPIYAGHRPHIDAAGVAMARERGAVMLGKVATSEFATQTPSDTCNPLNPRHTPGGSSSGSAAAVADRMAPVAFGTQTTASIIRPASFCGVVGYKPTWGFIGSGGLKPLSPSQDTVGVLARSVADAAFFAFGVHGATVAMKPDLRPRLAVCRSSQWNDVRSEMADAIERLATRLEQAGATVTRVTLPAELEALIPLQLRLFAYEARQSLAVERIHHHAQLSERLRQRLHGGFDITAAEYLDMRRRAAAGRHSLRALFRDVDALLYPPATGEAPEGLLDSGSAQFGALWSLMGVPCVSVPMATGPAGLPMGVQVISEYGEDERALAVADFVEAHALRRG